MVEGKNGIVVQFSPMKCQFLNDHVLNFISQEGSILRITYLFLTCIVYQCPKEGLSEKLFNIVKFCDPCYNNIMACASYCSSVTLCHSAILSSLLIWKI